MSVEFFRSSGHDGVTGQPVSADGWREECNYIDAVMDKRARVPEMNHDLGTFTRYCEMQRGAAARGGFHDAAQHIQHCLDDIPHLRALEVFEWAVVRQSDLGPGIASTCAAFRMTVKELEGIVAGFEDPGRHMAIVRAPGAASSRRIEAYYNTSGG